MEVEAQLNEDDATKRISFSIWPPSRRTRETVIDRLIETLSTPSVLSNRYGTMTPHDASAAARQIEHEAFAVAASSASFDDDGIQIVQLYTTEITKLLLHSVKASAAIDNDATQTAKTEGSLSLWGLPFIAFSCLVHKALSRLGFILVHFLCQSLFAYSSHRHAYISCCFSFASFVLEIISIHYCLHCCFSWIDRFFLLKLSYSCSWKLCFLC